MQLSPQHIAEFSIRFVLEFLEIIQHEGLSKYQSSLLKKALKNFISELSVFGVIIEYWEMH